MFPFLRKKREVHYYNCLELEETKITILLSPPVIHKLKEQEGRVGDLLGLNVFVDV